MENLRKSFLEEQEKSIEHSRVKKNKKVKTDLRFMSSKSVQKSLANFMYRQEFSRKQKQKQNEIKKKFQELRSYLNN